MTDDNPAVFTVGQMVKHKANGLKGMVMRLRDGEVLFRYNDFSGDYAQDWFPADQLEHMTPEDAA